jgi:hypothetical protein
VCIPAISPASEHDDINSTDKFMSTNDVELKKIAKFVNRMAETGIGTDHCLAEGCLPLKVHFYSPVPDIKDLDRRQVWKKISPLRGLRMKPESQLQLLTEMTRRFSAECLWPVKATANPHDFHLDNSSFCFQCASLLHYMIRYYRPKRIIEAGSGFSSRIMNAALGLNLAEGDACQYRVIDPYPSEITKTLPHLTDITVGKIEETPEALFSELESGDILFVDSGHVVKIGSDVNFLILEVLPLLKPGVVVHFHDIPMPTEYTRVYYTNPSFRVLWTESYLLQAFLAFNDEFEILCAGGYLAHHYPKEWAAVFPADAKQFGTGSFWIRRH